MGQTLDDPGAQVARRGSNVRRGYVKKGAIASAFDEG